VLDTEIVASKGRGTPRERLDQSRKMDERMRTAATAVQALVSQASASAPAHAAPSSMVTHRRRAPPWAHAPRSTRVLAEVQLPNGQRCRCGLLSAAVLGSCVHAPRPPHAAPHAWPLHECSASRATHAAHGNNRGELAVLLVCCRLVRLSQAAGAVRCGGWLRHARSRHVCGAGW
jgi:hypothetical protein